MLEGEGRFANRPYGGRGWIPAPRLYGGQALRGKNGEAGMTWWPTGNGDGRPQGSPLRGERLAGYARSHVTGDDEGRPYVGRGDGEG